MEKVKITVEQEKVLGSWRELCRKYDVSLLDWFVKSPNRGKWKNDFKALNNIAPEQFALLVHGWYEVEQPFKVGDWVKWTFKEKTEYLKITKVEEGSLRFSDDSTGFLPGSCKHMEKVTEPWKITLLNAGREKPEFKAGDIVETESDYYCIEENDAEDFFQEVIMLFEKDLVRVFYAVEHRIEVKGHDS